MGWCCSSSPAAIAAASGNVWEPIGPTSVVFPLLGIPVNPGAVLYTPTATVELIRGFVLQGAATNPLVIAAPGTSILVGIKQTVGGVVATMFSAGPAARINGFLVGTGSENATAQQSASGSGQILLAKADALFPGSASRNLRVWTDAGTASGTLVVLFERHVVIP